MDECVAEADGVLLRDVVVQGMREEGHLVSMEALDMFHGGARSRQGGGLSL